MFCADLQEVRAGIGTMGLSEVCAQATFSFVNV